MRSAGPWVTCANLLTPQNLDGNITAQLCIFQMKRTQTGLLPLVRLVIS